MMLKPRRDKGASPVAVHAILAVLALVVAYATWTRDRAQVQSDTVVALDASKRDIDKVTYEDETRTVTVERQTTSSGDPYAWVTTTQRSKTLVTTPPVPAAPGQPGAGTPGTPGAPAPAGAKAPVPPQDAGPKTPPPPIPHGAAAPAKVPVSPGAPAGGPRTDTRAPVKAPAREPAKDKPAAKGGDKAAADKDGSEKRPPGAPPVPPAAGKPAGAPPVAAAGKPAGAPPAGAPPAAVPGARPGGTSPAPAAPAPAPPGPAAAPAAGAPAAPAPAAPIHEFKETTTVKAFRGNEQADKLLESFAPLHALRALGTLDEAKSKELGLTESKKSITVTMKGKTVKFVLGSTSYGAGDIYAKDPQGQVFLLSQRISGDFEYAESRLMERRLHRFERGDVTSVEVTVGGKKKMIYQQKRQDQVNYFWTTEPNSDKRDDTMRNWMDKVLRLAISDYVAKGEEPQGPGMSQAGGPQYGEVMTMRFFDGRKEIGNAVFSRYPKGTMTEYYAKTETTVGLVKLLSQTAESAVQDAEKW